MQEHQAIGVRQNGRPASLYVNDGSRKPLFGRTEDGSENQLHVYTAKTPGFSRIGMGAATSMSGGDSATGLRKPRPVSEGFFSTRDQANANANANSSVLSSGGTRIPRLNSTRRKPISLRKAMELAEGEEEAAKLMHEAGLDDPVAVDGSPSPAPRPWRTRTASEVSELQRVLGADHLDTKGRSKIPSARNSNLSATLVGGREGAISPARATRLTGADGLVRQRSTEFVSPAIRNALRSGANRDATATTGTGTGTSGLPELVPGIEDFPLDPALSAATLVQRSSPDKSFAWQMDEDFTAGELQISDSPRVRVGTRPFASRLGFRDDGKQDFDNLPRLANPGSRNSKLDEIRSLELRANGSQIPLAPQTRLRPPNTKLEEIRAREGQVERQFPLASRHLDGLRNNTKLDDIRQREADGVSKRAFAAARLQEIKEQNSMARPRSPDDEPKPRPTFGLARRRLTKQEPVEDVKKDEQPPLLRPRTSFGGGEFGRQISDAPTTFFGRDTRRAEEEDKVEAAFPSREPLKKLEIHEQKRDNLLAKPKPFERRPDEHDLLRRLARAASSSPPPEDEPRTKQLPTPPPGDEERKQTTAKSIADRIASRIFSRRASAGDNPAATTTATTATTTTTTDFKDSEKPKPTVGFTGLQRSRSVESAKSKRSSMQSEPDPTARIEAEMKLFAPSDNQSERGSIRAPSPTLDDSDEDDNGLNESSALITTPKPSKPDPLSMPTPIVTGAYVETPVTVKTEKLVLKPESPVPEMQEEVKAPAKTSAEPPASLFQARKPSFSSWRSRERSQDQDTASDPGTTDDGGDIALASVAAKKPRAKSLPRRKPPMKNSARPPSAKDDLMQLRREYDMEDSTFDDLDEFIANAKKAAKLAVPESDPLPPSTVAADNFDLDLESESDPSDVIKGEGQKDDEMAAFERMNKSLQTGLLRIRSAKQGIERFEDRFDRYSRAQPQPVAPQPVALPEKTETKVLPQVKQETKPLAQVKQETKPLAQENKDIKPLIQAKKDTKTKVQAPKGHAHHYHKTPRQGCPYCKPSLSSSTSSSATPVTYLHLTLPQLFHRTPTFHLTWLGVFTLILSLWYAAEATMCSMYCRPTTCPASKSPCVWSFDDPTDFGTALPIKLDQWITGGQGRQVASFAYEEAYDFIADMQDLALRRDITQVDTESLSPEQKRRHRRRLRKKGLVASAREPLPEEKAKWDEWRALRLAKQRAEKGHDEKAKPKPVDDDEEQGWVKIGRWR
ncbi:hypothetical protein TsFJ059_007927 [Trichoderma semiorbis]|uniref:Uncharacterized protein n=1 Tax=Trichoderma semiorbis TaxID=1491008 RepID=A0A9P8KQY3_9HYPO|nr:hypothetical protein TsFJ059_007927 [Trichoderma semiorbis]